ncbi:MAG: dockerin type I repeat-containing protein [Ruminococcus sp.]|nr:dockerin type I repeat-containing protein [Ruminococcus sp.]
MKVKKFLSSMMAVTLVSATMGIVDTVLIADAEIADSYTASLQGQIIDTGFWDDSYASCTVTGDGTYSVSYTYTGVGGTTNSETTDTCLMLKFDFNVYNVSSSGDLAETGIVIDINSVDVDGTSLNYSGSSSNSNAYRVDDDGKTIRHNIYNLWSTGQDTTDIDNFTITEGQTLTVSFTVSGLEDAIEQAKVLAGEITDSDNDDNTSLSLLDDVNLDGKVNTADLLTLKRYLLGLSDDESICSYGDINLDGKTNTADLLMLKRYLLGLVDLTTTSTSDSNDIDTTLLS